MSNDRPNRKSPVPVYQQIAATLRSGIRDGQYPPGAKLPSERKLAAHFNASVLTVRSAIAELRNAGLVRAEQGKGLFVRELPPIIRKSGHRLSRAERERGAGAFMTDAEDMGFTPRVEADIYPDSADDRIAELLGIQPGDPIFVRARLMFADEDPVQIATSYLPRSITKGTRIEEQDTGPGGTYARLEEAGFPLTAREERKRARNPTPEQAVALQLADGVPVLHVVRLMRSGDRVVEVNEMVLDGDRYELVDEYPPE